MSAEENKALLRRLVDEGLHKKNLGIMDELISPSFVNHSAPAGIPPTRDGYRQYVEMLLASFPDIYLDIEDLIAEGDKVVVRYTVRGTHQGSFMGLPPSGKQFSFTGIGIQRIVDGKFVERWEQADTLGVLQQLGVIPA
jgi:steroid delta-isomerase-like uncharacterized protein